MRHPYANIMTDRPLQPINLTCHAPLKGSTCQAEQPYSRTASMAAQSSICLQSPADGGGEVLLCDVLVHFPDLQAH